MASVITTETAAAGKACGACGMCCKVLHISELEKPAGVWCGHFKKGSGCGDYAGRPSACRGFLCLWITQDFLGPDWKPEKARFVLTMDAATRWLFVQADPGAAQAWRKEP